MKAILVDDEMLALRRMEKLLKEQDGKEVPIEIVGSFQNPHLALKAAERETIHLVFLDIEMPEMDGMELAECLLRIQPHLHIVFVTAYNEYAVEAFELNALDYLLKPVQRTRIEKTLKRLAKPAQANDAGKHSQLEGMLCTLSYLHYITPQQELKTFHGGRSKRRSYSPICFTIGSRRFAKIRFWICCGRITALKSHQPIYIRRFTRLGRSLSRGHYESTSNIWMRGTGSNWAA